MSQYKVICASLLFIWLGLSACGVQNEPPPTPTIIPPTATPITYTCADIDAAWGSQWETVIAAITFLQAQGATCGAEPLASKAYAAHFSYAAALEKAGDTAAAIVAYQRAYELDPSRPEAINALGNLGHLPAPTPVACEGAPTPIDPASPLAIDPSQFMTVQGDQLMLNGEPFMMRGVNYYPRHAPWHRFLESADPDEMAQELDLIAGAGFNTLRVFLRYDALFNCDPELAAPNETTFALVDTLIALAKERHLRLLVTLNDLPDLRFRPLYTDWNRYDAQTIYIVRRYRHEPTILAWDLRNEADLDYIRKSGDTSAVLQENVIRWLAHISAVVKEHDPLHPITAGWLNDPSETAPYVDFLSFHHWSNAAALGERIEEYREKNDKPLLLEEVGFSSRSEGTSDERQAELLAGIRNTAESEGLAGWLVWAAFDFEPEPGQPANAEHFFGLWRTDLTPKPAVEAIKVNP